MSDLVEFLRARLDEDEQTATAATSATFGEDPTWTSKDDGTGPQTHGYVMADHTASAVTMVTTCCSPSLTTSPGMIRPACSGRWKPNGRSWTSSSTTPRWATATKQVLSCGCWPPCTRIILTTSRVGYRLMALSTGIV